MLSALCAYAVAKSGGPRSVVADCAVADWTAIDENTNQRDRIACLLVAAAACFGRLMVSIAGTTAQRCVLPLLIGK